MVQPVDDHDIAVLDSEAEHIERLAGSRGFVLAAFKVNDWNADLSPWEAPPVFGDEAFGSGAPSGGAEGGGCRPWGCVSRARA